MLYEVITGASISRYRWSPDSKCLPSSSIRSAKVFSVLSRSSVGGCESKRRRENASSLAAFFSFIICPQRRGLSLSYNFVSCMLYEVITHNIPICADLFPLGGKKIRRKFGSALDAVGIVQWARANGVKISKCFIDSSVYLQQHVGQIAAERTG